MVQSSVPLIDLDWARFQPWRVTKVSHHIADHRLLKPDQLSQLAKRLERTGKVRSHSNTAQANTPFNHAPQMHPNEASVTETLENICEAKAWLSLLNVQTDDVYRKLIDEVLDEVRPLIEAKDPGMSYRSGWIFVSSPHTITPFHMDKEHSFILQISGRKVVYVWEPDDLEVVSQLARDRFHAWHDRALVRWQEEFRKRAHRFEFGPGDGAYMPSTAPHLVEVGDEPSITINFSFYTESSRRRSLLHFVRGHLSKGGIKLPAVGESALLDQFVYHGAGSFREARRAVRRSIGKKSNSEHDWYAQQSLS